MFNDIENIVVFEYLKNNKDKEIDPWIHSENLFISKSNYLMHLLSHHNCNWRHEREFVVSFPNWILAFEVYKYNFKTTSQIDVYHYKLLFRTQEYILPNLHPNSIFRN